jgi:hypothetical protein
MLGAIMDERSVLRQRLVLAVVPLGLVGLALWLRHERGPFYFAFNFDPAYTYLMNSLGLLALQQPQHVDHPGTPLQVLGAVVIALQRLAERVLGDPWPSPLGPVLADPERYLRSIHLALVSLMGGAVYLLGHGLLRRTGSIFVALAGPGLLLGSLAMLVVTSAVMPDHLVIAAAALLSWLLPPPGHGPLPLAQEHLRWSLIGVVLGFGMATKVTLLPLFAVLLLAARPAVVAIALASSAVAFAICTLPVWTQLPRMGRWLGAVAMHSGLYGHGDVGLPSAGSLVANTLGLVIEEPLLAVELFVLIAALVRVRRGNIGAVGATPVAVARYLEVVILILLVQGLVVVKHPRVWYLVPAVVFAAGPTAWAAVLLTSESVMRRQIAVFLFASCITVLLGLNVLKVDTRLRSAPERDGSLARVTAHADKIGCRTIEYYQASSVPYALSFGQNFTAGPFTEALSALYPHTWSFNLWSHQFAGFGGPISEESLRRNLGSHSRLCLVGTEWLPLPRRRIAEAVTFGSMRLYVLAPP